MTTPLILSDLTTDVLIFSLREENRIVLSPADLHSRLAPSPKQTSPQAQLSSTPPYPLSSKTPEPSLSPPPHQNPSTSNPSRIISGALRKSKVPPTVWTKRKRRAGGGRREGS